MRALAATLLTPPSLFASTVLAGIVLASCGPARVVPAVGTRLETHACFVVRGVAVYREPIAACPDLASTEERIRQAEEKYGASIAGSRITIVSALIQCGAVTVRGCSIPGEATVMDGLWVHQVIGHEAAHLAIWAKGGPYADLAHYDLDNPGARHDMGRRRNWRRIGE